MAKRQKGYAFILVLIFLMVGALTIVPMLRFTYTSLKQVRIVGEHNRGLVAADAAQHLVMWKLLRGGLTDYFSSDGDSVNFTLTLCDTFVDVSVIMRAIEQTGGVILATDDTIIPTKTVSPSNVSNGYSGTFTYTIALEQVSSNNTGQLEVIYDILPDAFGNNFSVYQTGSSQISIDGNTWTTLPYDPSYETYSQQMRLRWPATGNFTDPTFKQFEPGETHYLKFSLTKALGSQFNNSVACNWVVIRVADVLTVSGPQASLVIGSPADPDACKVDGLFNVWKSSDPEIIPPLVSTNVTYTVHITNMTGATKRIGNIDDYLPPGFVYISENTSGDIAIGPAYSETVTKNGVERNRIYWLSEAGQLTSNGWSMVAGENLTMVFRAVATQGVSGSYYNEVIVAPSSMPASYGIFTDIADIEGIEFTTGDIGSMYSWNSGLVIVPAFDSSTGSGGENITANFGLDASGITINSWHVR